MIALSEFQAYLKALCQRYEQWWSVDVLTETIAAQQATFSFEQMVETEEKHSEESLQRVRLPIFKGIQDYIESEHILLVGSPGVGKSTTLLRCLVQFAEREQVKPEPRIPVLVELKRYNSDSFSCPEDLSGILTLIKDTLEPDLWLEVSEIKKLLFQDRRLILLLDGLNEMSAGEKRTELEAFRKKCDRCKVPLICTTRKLDGGDLGIKRKLEIQSLDPTEIDRFLQECLPEQKQKVSQLLNRDNRELSLTPFVLWMLYHLSQEQGTEVETLGEAFRQFFRSFKKHKEAAPVAEERRKDWHRWLEYLAFKMLDSSEPTDPGLIISEEQAESILVEKFGDRYGTAPRIEELLKYHLLESISEREISFHHQLIQEYYAAEYLLTQLPELLKEGSEQNYISFQAKYLNYLKWTEAIALMFGLPEVPGNQVKHLVELALDIDLTLGARLVGKVKQQLQAQTVEVLNQLIAQQNLPAWLKVELLGETKSNFSIAYLFQFLSHPNIDIVQRSASFIGETTNSTAIALLTQRLEEIDSKFFAQTSFAGADSTGDLWTAHIKALAHIAPQTAIQFLRSKLIDKVNGREKEIIHAVTQAPQLLMQLDGELILPKLIEDLCNLQTEDQDWIRLFEKQLKEQSENKNHVDPMGWELTPKRIEQIKEFAIKKRKSQILNLISCASSYESIVLALIKALEYEEDISIQIRIIQLIGQSSNKLIGQTLIKLLSHEDFKIRKEAGAQLIERKTEETDGIEKLLDHKNWDVAWSAAVVLGSLGYTIAFPILAEALQKREFKYLETRCITAKVLSSLSEETSVPLLLDILSSDLDDEAEAFLRGEAAFSLSQFGREEAIPELKLTLRVGYRNGYSSGIRGLARLNVEEPLREILITKAPGWQTAAVELGKLGRTDVLPELCKALVDLGGESADEVIHLLSEFADPNTIDWLLEALENPEQHTADPYFPNRIALVLIECNSDILQNRLSSLMSLINRKYIQQLFWAIPVIQSHCGFYNYEIAQFSQTSLPISETTEDLLSTINQTTQETYEKVNKMTDQPKVQMIFNDRVEYAVGNVEGDMVINSAPSQEANTAISNLFNNLRQKYPNATDEEIYDSLLRGFQDMPQKNPQNWQRWQDVLSVFFSGGIEATKVFVPIAGIPIEVIKRLYEVYDRNRKKLLGS